MTKRLVAMTAVALLAGAPLPAQEHLLSAEAARQRLLDAAATREGDLRALDAVIASAEGSALLSAAGLETARVRATLRALDDRELRELAARVNELQADPVAGAAFTGKQVGIVAAVILIGVFIIIIA